MLFRSNGKGGSELAARASALGEYFERLSTNYFWTHFYLGETIANRSYVHHPDERWFALDGGDDAWPTDLLTPALHGLYNPDERVRADQLIDLNSGNTERGICAIPYGASTPKELVENADMAVYQVKRSGKNAIRLSTGGTSPGELVPPKEPHRSDVYSEYASTIYALTAAIDTKDHYTFSHSKNVAYYASELAYACNMNEDMVEIVREAALLHDIGKIGINEQILNKPDRLSYT